MVDMVLFEEEILDLQRELMHPAHAYFNSQFPQAGRSFGEVLQDFCTHFGIVVDGMYSRQDQLALCVKVTKKLEEMRLNALANITLSTPTQ